MKTCQYISTNKDGVTTFDNYFSHLEQLKSQLPKHIAEFFCDREAYYLRGDTTLHDAWIESFTVKNTYENNTIMPKFEITLLLADHLTRVRLNYDEISSLEYANEPQVWIDNAPSWHKSRQRYKDKAVDLLVHEFDVIKNGYSHLMVFDRNVYFYVEFKQFAFAYY